MTSGRGLGIGVRIEPSIQSAPQDSPTRPAQPIRRPRWRRLHPSSSARPLVDGLADSLVAVLSQERSGAGGGSARPGRASPGLRWDGRRSRCVGRALLSCVDEGHSHRHPMGTPHARPHGPERPDSYTRRTCPHPPANEAGEGRGYQRAWWRARRRPQLAPASLSTSLSLGTRHAAVGAASSLISNATGSER